VFGQLQKKLNQLEIGETGLTSHICIWCCILWLNGAWAALVFQVVYSLQSLT